MSDPSAPPGPASGNNRRRLVVILLLAAGAAALYGWVAWIGDLRGRPGLYLAVHAALLAGMVGGRWAVRGAGAGGMRLVLGAALGFRLIAAWGAPALSDDVYRYVWDGRVQWHGVHPYRFAPEDPALEPLRDADWARINHPGVKTIYPPLAEAVFLALAAANAGPRGFKLAMGILDFAVVLALGLLLRRLSLPRDRVVWYAWNPLAVIETAGSGHCEPIGALGMVLAVVWLLERRGSRSALALAGAVHSKLLPAVLVPGFVRRLRARDVGVLAASLALLALPYALWGPAVPPGLAEYAERWEGNAFVFALVHEAAQRLDTAAVLKPRIDRARNWLGEGAIPWNWIYRRVWPGELARALVGVAGLGWVLVRFLRAGPCPAREALLVIGGVLLLSPTIHPWYLLWCLPWAAAFSSRGWLLLAALVPLAYLGRGGEVPWAIRVIEFVPALLLMAWDQRAGRGAPASPASPEGRSAPLGGADSSDRMRGCTPSSE